LPPITTGVEAGEKINLTRLSEDRENRRGSVGMTPQMSPHRMGLPEARNTGTWHVNEFNVGEMEQGPSAS